MPTMMMLFLSFSILSAPLAIAATESSNDTFEKSFQEFGKKLDEAKARGAEVGQATKKEWLELRNKTEKATEQAAAESKEKREEWGDRLKGAVTELGSGLNKAWAKLKGEK